MKARVKKSKPRARLQKLRIEIRQIMEDVTANRLDPYLGYRRLYQIYCYSSGTHDELRPFFQIPSAEPDGQLHVDDAIRRTVRDVAKGWLRDH
jgi:hypothetical protein